MTFWFWYYPHFQIPNPNIRMTLMTQVGGVVSVLVVIAIIVLVGALVHR